MMEARRFDPDEDYKELEEWSSVRGIPGAPAYLFPEIGRIVPGVCAVFLYQTDSGVGFIENLIGNPRVKGVVMADAIDTCVKAIEDDAKENNVALLWGSTFIENVAKRASALGFAVSGGDYKLISKRLI